MGVYVCVPLYKLTVVFTALVTVGHKQSGFVGPEYTVQHMLCHYLPTTGHSSGSNTFSTEPPKNHKNSGYAKHTHYTSTAITQLPKPS